jgi:hypothetical protein
MEVGLVAQPWKVQAREVRVAVQLARDKPRARWDLEYPVMPESQLQVGENIYALWGLVHLVTLVLQLTHQES